jgi:RNA polymerase sigma-70 factor (ECF subfamily)
MATFDPESILIEGAHLRRLARDLVDGAAEAEDLVQETWLRALAKPARAGFSLRSWLAGLMKNVARERRRSEERRDARERIVAALRPDAARAAEPDDPAAVAERFDLLRRVLAFIVELPEPQRTTLLRRYVDGLEPSVIARRDGVPDATVRNRIKRGLDELRARLDADHRGARAAWIAVLLPCSRPHPLAVAGTSSAVFGGLVMKIASTKIAAAGLIAVVAGFAVLSWIGRTPVRRPVASPPASKAMPPSVAPATAAAATAARTETPTASLRPGDDDKAADDEESGRGWRLEGVLHGLDPSISWTGSIRATVVASVWTEAMPPSYLAKLDVQGGLGDGRFAIDLPLECRDTLAAIGSKEGKVVHWRGLQIQAQDPEYVDVGQYVDVLDASGGAHAPPFTFHVDLKTRPTAHVHGRVVNERGEPLGGVTVGWEDFGGAERQPSITDGFGRYRLESSSVGKMPLHAWVATPPSSGAERALLPALEELMPATIEAECTPGVDSPVADIVLHCGATIDGLVVDASGDPEPGAVVTAHRGSSAPGVSLKLSPEGATLVLGKVPSDAPSSDDPQFSIERKTTCDDEGRFRIKGLKPGLWLVGVTGRGSVGVHPVVQLDRGVTATEVTAPAHDVEIVDPLALLQLHVTFRSSPLSQTPICIRGTSRDALRSSDLGGQTDANGDLEFLGLPGCPFQLFIFNRSDIESSTPPIHLDEGDVDRRFVIEAEPRHPRASLAVRLRGPSDAKLTRAWLRATPSSGDTDPIERSLDSADGTFVLADLPLGTYRVLVRPGAGDFGTGGFFEEQSLDVTLAEPIRSEISLDVRPTGRLQVRVLDPDGNGIAASLVLSNARGEPIASTFARVDSNSAVYSPDLTIAEGCFVTPPPPPGRYHLALSAEGFFSKSIDAEVRSCETTDVVVTLVRR